MAFSLVNVHDVFYVVGGYDKGSITLNNGQKTGGQTTQRYIPLGYTGNAYPSSTPTHVASLYSSIYFIAAIAIVTATALVVVSLQLLRRHRETTNQS